MNKNIAVGTFVSVWDFHFEVWSSCKVDLDTREVFDIEIVNVEELDCERLTGEFVILDGVKYDVWSTEYCPVDQLPTGVFWRG